MTLGSEIRDYFKCSNLYDVLEVQKNATTSQLKKAYYRLALKLHPDKNTDDGPEKAKFKFQLLSKVHEILADGEKRKIYDETGNCEGLDEVKNVKNWDQYFRNLFRVTKKDIINFENIYKGSEEERNDIKTAYVESEGDMNKILESVCLATIGDEDRFRSIIRELVKSKEVPEFTKFTNESKKSKDKRKAKYQKEAREAEQLGNELGLNGSDNSLEQAILKRNEARMATGEAFLDNLAAKYSSKTKRDAPKQQATKKAVKQSTAKKRQSSDMNHAGPAKRTKRK